MSYVDRTADPNGRTTAIIGVIAIHSVIAYLLVTGLTYVRLPTFVHNPTGFPVPTPTPTPPPPPPTPQPSPTTTSDPIPGPQTPFPFPTPTPVPDPFPTPNPLPTSVPSPIPTGTGTHTVAFKPRPATPKNDPTKWVTTDDYPARDLREGNEGTSVFRVTVGTNGRVSACEIVTSSGHPGLDAATCKAVTARARFNPATDEHGDAVVGTYSNRVRWQIPR
jgi:protein TonB